MNRLMYLHHHVLAYLQSLAIPYLFLCFGQEMSLACAEAIQKGHLLELLVEVLMATHDLLASFKDVATPK